MEQYTPTRYKTAKIQQIELQYRSYKDGCQRQSCRFLGTDCTFSQFSIVSIFSPHRCSSKGICKAHIYSRTWNSTCVLIQNQPTDGLTFRADDHYAIYIRSEMFLFNKRYSSWSLRQFPVAYRSFDYTFNLRLMRGAKLLTGKVGNRSLFTIL